MSSKIIPYIPRRWIEHGGSLAICRRKSKRPLNPKKTCHLVLRSIIAKRQRALTKHQTKINFILARSAVRFQIRIHKKAICSNHIHLLVQAKRKIDLQNFFRVVAGHIAQEILRSHPLQSKNSEWGNAQNPTGKEKYRRKFWEHLAYTRIVNWGRDFVAVNAYILQNTLETLFIIPYQDRTRRYNNTS